MKIEKISDTDYKLFVYSCCDKGDNLVEEVKCIIKRLQKMLKLSGFYRVIVCQKSFGLFIHLVKIEDSFYKSALDLRIISDDEMDVYYKTNDYFIIKDSNLVKYYGKYFYALVDDSFTFDLKNVEFGDFVFGKDWEEILDNSFVV